jgi:hypothetical protein
MELDRDAFVVISSWTNDRISGCISCHKIGQGEDESLDELINAEDCVHLSKPASSGDEDSTACWLTASIARASHIRFARITIVSEAKRVELYRTNGEYLRTFEGVLLEDSDPDLCAFSVAVEASEYSLSACQLKLTGLADGCWVLAVRIAYAESDGFKSEGSRFAADQLSARLGDVMLSEKAQGFKTLFDTFQASLPKGLVSPEVMAVQAMQSVHSRSANHEKQCCGCATAIQDLEKRIMTRLDSMESEQNKKLELILSLLRKGAGSEDETTK